MVLTLPHATSFQQSPWSGLEVVGHLLGEHHYTSFIRCRGGNASGLHLLVQPQRDGGKLAQRGKAL